MTNRPKKTVTVSGITLLHCFKIEQCEEASYLLDFSKH